jgi:hypothetical protein
MAIARQQAAVTAAIVRYEMLAEKAETDAKRLALADERLARGDVRVACMIYARMASVRPPTDASESAKKKLAEVQEQARQKLEDLDRKLAAAHSGPLTESRDYTSQGFLGSAVADGAGDKNSAAGAAQAVQPLEGQSSGAPAMVAEKEPREAEVAVEGESPQAADSASAGMGGRIIALFRQYDRLVNTYGQVPGVGSQIKAHVAKLRRQPDNASALNEPAAGKLWELGQQHEREDQLCCAYWAYKDAAKLAPAPSAVLARLRFAELAEDPQVVASAETCRELKWCHQAYVRAERLLSAKPEVAGEIYAEIVKRAPADSEVYRAAQGHLR